MEVGLGRREEGMDGEGGGEKETKKWKV